MASAPALGARWWAYRGEGAFRNGEKIHVSTTPRLNEAMVFSTGTGPSNVVVFDFGDKTLTWENRSWAPHTPNDPAFDVAFYGEKGMLAMEMRILSYFI